MSDDKKNKKDKKDKKPGKDAGAEIDPELAPVASGDPDAKAEIEAAAEREQEQPHLAPEAGFGERFIAAVTSTSVLVTVLALFSALVVGALIIALSEDGVRDALGYVTARPSDFFSLASRTVADAYSALFAGAVGSTRSLSETMTSATPLILTGLAVTVPLRAGMFNIGGEGQIIAGGIAAGVAGFAFTGLPLIIHLPIAILAGILGGAAYGWIPGILKARTGAHEVITTIMLNNIAILLTDYLLSTSFIQRPGRNDPISKNVLDSAILPRLLGSGFRLHAGLLLALLAGVVVWWLLERSTSGFEINAVGSNPNAATTAGMSVTRVTVLVMVVAGAMAGLGGSAQILGIQGRITGGFSAGLGFDGITVALLGRGKVGGTVAAGFLFGALKAGGLRMQAETGTSLDLVVVIQALIIVFVAAPALVRAIYRIKAEGAVTGQIAKGWGA